MWPSTHRIGKDIRACFYLFTRRAADVISEAFFTAISFFFFFSFESLLSHKINNHISYVTTLKEGIYINYRENQDKNYKTRLCLKTKRLTNVFLNLSVFILGW